MGNEITAQAGTQLATGFALPAHLQTAMAEAGGGNIQETFTRANTLSTNSKSWVMTVNGKTIPLVKTDPDTGIEEPMQIVSVIVLDQSAPGRSYYEGWDPENPRRPDCWSPDGKRPDASVENPPCKTCSGCPKTFKGSKVIDGKEMIACDRIRYLALLPVKMDKGQYAIAHSSPVLRLRIKNAALWDGQDEEGQAQGWFAWDNFTKMLAANGARWTNATVVQMRFDPRQKITYAKIQFKRGDFLSAEDFKKTSERAKSDEVRQLLEGYTAPTEGQKALGKPLPPDEPAGDPVFSQSGAAAQAAQEAESARLKTEAYEADLARLAQEAEAKKAQAADDAAASKAAKIAEARRMLAEAEAEAAGGFDEPAPPPAPVVSAPAPVKEAAPPKRNTKKAAEPAPPTQIAEVPEALTGILDAWA